MTMSKIMGHVLAGAAIACFAFSAAAKQDTSSEDTSYDFMSDMEGFTHRLMVLRPEVATYYGISDKEIGVPVSRQLSHYDPESEKNRRAGLEDILEDMRAIDASAYTARQNLTLELLIYSLEGLLLPSRVVDYGTVVGDYGNWFLVYPLNHLSGPHVEFGTIMEGKFVINSPATSPSAFGHEVKVLPNGNFVTTDPEFGTTDSEYLTHNIEAGIIYKF